MTISNLVDRTHTLAGDDEALAQAAKSDHAAFDALYRRYVNRVYRYCYTHAHNAPDAEDLTAQTFLAALEGIRRYRGRGPFAAWLFTIARHKCNDYHRDRYKRRDEMLEKAEGMPDPTTPDMAARAFNQRIVDCVQRVLSVLSKDRQEAIRLRFWGGLSTRETAKVMRRSRGAVKMLVSRGLADLRERCLDEG